MNGPNGLTIDADDPQRLYLAAWGRYNNQGDRGATLKALDRMAHPFLSTGLYLGMGWLCVIAAKPLLLSVATPGLVLLAAGGLAYTAGVVFFALDSRLRYAHFVWHLFVVAGTACHFFAVLDYSI